MSFTFIDLFAGIGGFRLGMEALGGECVFGSEIDKHAVATYERNFGEKPAGDITKIDARDVPDHDILCGGFPCQPFSVSGKRLGFEDARGTLFFEIMRIVKEKRPQAVFLENVANYVTHQNGETLKRTLEMLREAGYVANHSVLNASEYGVPQARKRLYIVGVRKDREKVPFRFPEPVEEKIALKEFLVSKEEAEGMAIERSDIDIYKTDVSGDLNGRSNKPIQIGRISKGGQGERVYSIEGHAITLSAHGGGAASKTGAYLIDGVVRRLHPIECRRVMGFPEDFRIDPRAGQAYKQFGNAVVVDVVEAIGRKLLESVDVSPSQTPYAFDHKLV